VRNLRGAVVIFADSKR